MRIKLFILTFLFLFFGVRPAFATIEFNISNPQNNGGEVSFNVSISGLTSSSCLNNLCYLQAAFSSPSPIRYFGFTKNNNGGWYEYASSPGSDFIQSTFFAFTPANGGWSGQLAVKINPENTNYKGSGEYTLKAWRYSGNSNSYSGDSDNALSISIEGPATPTSTPTPLPTTSPTHTPTPTKTPSPTPAPTPKKTTSPTNTPTPSSTPVPSPSSTLKSTPIPNSSENEIDYRIASVAGAQVSATQEAKVEVKDQKQINTFFWAGLIFIFAGVSSIGYIYIKKNETIRIWFRR